MWQLKNKRWLSTDGCTLSPAYILSIETNITFIVCVTNNKHTNIYIIIIIYLHSTGANLQGLDTKVHTYGWYPS